MNRKAEKYRIHINGTGTTQFDLTLSKDQIWLLKKLQELSKASAKNGTTPIIQIFSEREFDSVIEIRIPETIDPQITYIETLPEKSKIGKAVRYSTTQNLQPLGKLESIQRGFGKTVVGKEIEIYILSKKNKPITYVAANDVDESKTIYSE